MASLDAMSSVEWPLALCVSPPCLGLGVKGLPGAGVGGRGRVLSGAEGLTFGRNLRAHLPSCRCYLTAAILPLPSYHLVTLPLPYYRCHFAVAYE